MWDICDIQVTCHHSVHIYDELSYLFDSQIQSSTPGRTVYDERVFVKLLFLCLKLFHVFNFLFVFIIQLLMFIQGD
jgi:hypothetical protein